ncbi:hypothetical protein LX32DRAFT_657661, partial [Colletotrichum zoysiae]
MPPRLMNELFIWNGDKSNSTLSILEPSPRSAASLSKVSPTKQVADRQNILVYQYGPNVEGIPKILHKMWTDLARLGKGVKVIPKSQQTIESRFYAKDNIRSELGNIPSVSDALTLLNQAMVCCNDGYDEPNWNLLTHLNVLNLTVPIYAPGSTGKVSFIP